MDYTDIHKKMKEGEIDFSMAWNLYITLKILYSLQENKHIVSGPLSKDFLQLAGKIPDNRFSGLIKRLYKCIIGKPPKLSSIDFNGLSISFSSNSTFSGQELLKEIDDYLVKQKKTVWFLLDKIDELFSENSAVRKVCIEGLFRAQLEIAGRYSNIKLKIFLRDDIWTTLSFVNKSHITDKTIRITWNEASLATLIVKRALKNPSVRNYIISKITEKGIIDNSVNEFYSIFEMKVYPGKKEAKTLSWIIQRITDGQGGVYPRELINFAIYAKQNEKENPAATKEDILISGVSVRNAFAQVSRTKVETYLSEFPQLKEHFTRFNGQNKAEFSRTELIGLMVGLEPSENEMIRQLYETGVIHPNNGNTTTATRFEVPRLFRQGLGIVQSGRL